MEFFTLENDIAVFYISATSFPHGVLAAHQQLHSLVPYSTNRRYFGLSRSEEGVIHYKAATEETEAGEALKYGCETLTIPRGKYLSVRINDYMQDIPAIGKAFQEILTIPGYDPNGYCVEWYLNDTDVLCMVRRGDQ